MIIFDPYRIHFFQHPVRNFTKQFPSRPVEEAPIVVEASTWEVVPLAMPYGSTVAPWEVMNQEFSNGAIISESHQSI